MIGGDGFLGRCLFLSNRSPNLDLFIIFPFSIPLFNLSRCHSSWQTRTKASRSTFPLSSCLPDSHCHQCCRSCHTVTHAHICSMIHGKAKNNCRNWPNISLKKGGLHSKTSTLQQGLGLGIILWRVVCFFLQIRGEDLSCGFGSNHNNR